MSSIQAQQDALSAEFQRIARIEEHDPQACTDLRIAIQKLAKIVKRSEGLKLQDDDQQRRFDESQQRFDQYVERSEQDRTRILRLIESIAQRRNADN